VGFVTPFFVAATRRSNGVLDVGGWPLNDQRPEKPVVTHGVTTK